MDPAKHTYNPLIVLVLFIASASYTALAYRVSEKIYTDLQSNHYCGRRLNATHQMGCSSELGGNNGVVWIVEGPADLEHILKTGPTPPYTAILRREHYTRKNLLDFKSNLDRVSGVVFLDSNHADAKSLASPFSPEDRCPNRYWGLYANDTDYKDCKVNLWLPENPISGLLHDDFPFPIFLINREESINEIESCFGKNNVVRGTRLQSTYPLCTMQLDSFMLAASDSENCINSDTLVDELLQTNGRRCYNVENDNIFAFYKPSFGPLHPVENLTGYLKPDIVEAQSVVMLIAKLSSISMFSEISPGADSIITSLVTMLAAAEALGSKSVRSRPEVTNSKRNIAFALLDSEPFDFTGSTRMLFAMNDDSYPNKFFKTNNVTDALRNINIASLDYVINLDQLANHHSTSKIHLHSEPRDKDNPRLAKAINVLSGIASSEKLDFERVDSSLPLPPVPVQEFIKRSQTLGQNRKPIGLVLSNYGKTFTNAFHHSVYDDLHNVYQVSEDKLVAHLTKVATFVAKSLYQLAFASDSLDHIIVEPETVRQLLYCYLKNAKCGLFTQAWQAGLQLPNDSIQTYNDASRKSDDMNGAITANMISYFVGEVVPNTNSSQCYDLDESSLVYVYKYVNGKDEPVGDGLSGVCIRSQVLKTSSTSPAFELVDQSIRINKEYPAWTVSLNGIRNPVRIYLKPSPIQQWLTLILGIVVTIMSFVVVHHIRGSIAKLREDSDAQPGTST